MLLRLVDINKSFFGVKVLSNVSFELKSGEIHALVGQNGAGKTTLVNIVSGIFQPDDGEVIIDGRPVKIPTTNDAYKLGVSTIYQEPTLVPNISIAENIFLGNTPRLLKVFANFYKMKKETRKILKLLGLNLNPNALVKSLNIGEKYIISIARALVMNSKILIMDEPTAGLSDLDRERLFAVLKELKKKGTGIIYITHTLSELPKICDRVTILRDGKCIKTCGINEISLPQIINQMSGREISQYFPPSNKVIGQEILKIENLTKKPCFYDICFNLHEGEILGFAGLTGSGRTTLAKTIFGQIRKDSGRIIWHNKEVNFKHPKEAIRKGLGLLNENRFESGLFMCMNVTENMTISSLKDINRWQFIRQNTENDMVLDKVIDLDIKIKYLKQQIKLLSGGNQQKAALGRWLITRSDLLILDEPSRGMDIISKSDLYVAIRELSDQGKGVILISSDLEELMGLCTRIIVMRQGKIVDEIDHDNFSEERILGSMTCEDLKVSAR